MNLVDVDLPHLGGMVLPEAYPIGAQGLVVIGVEIVHVWISLPCERLAGPVIPLNPLTLS
jgi:hypothetical protein